MYKLVGLAWLWIVAGCATLPASSAIEDGRIALKVSEQDVFAAAGDPDLILARTGVETFFYKRSDTTAVSVSIHQGKVVAFDDSAAWPAEAARGTDLADEPVSTGKVRVGMDEGLLLRTFDAPDGLTAKDGVETFHWLTGDEVDSLVKVRGGKVEGFWDRPVSERTQNLPTDDRDNATTSGKIRVGMRMAEVEQLLGPPDETANHAGRVIHRYDSDPVFGDHIVFSVGYRDDRVVDLYLFNVSRSEGD